MEAEYPTVAFHASITNPFGKSALINLLRQFSKLHTDKKQISVGLVGYPNTGKSSIINTLKSKKVCNVAPVPGETKVWQYITLMKRIYLIDCPGVVYGSSDDTETDIVLKGVVRVEHLSLPEEHVRDVVKRVRPEYLVRTYGVKQWKDHVDFLAQVAIKAGKLLKGGDPDIPTASKMVLNDWIRGRIPFYTLPDIEKAADAPAVEPESGDVSDEEEDAGLLGRGPRVQQRMNKIRVTAEFLTDDLKNDSAPVSEGESLQEGSDQESSEDDEEAGWRADDQSQLESTLRFSDDDSDSSSSDAESKVSKQSIQSDEDDEKKKRRVEKAPRMTTNKRKVGTHYYETANVKNRNRNKKAASNSSAAKSTSKWRVEK